MISNISTTTRKNWNKLNTNIKNRLTKRANKCMSKKRFVPVEYFSHQKNVFPVQEAIAFIVQEKYPTEDVIYTLALAMLKKKGILDKDNVKTVLSDYSFNLIQKIMNIEWPEDERDLLGIVYQSLQYEGDKNKKGSYYTPEAVARNMILNLDFSQGQLFLDPCCGSGAFLLMLDNVSPDRLYGLDNDPIAVFIAKINLLVKYSNQNFIPNIKCVDYLKEQNNSKMALEDFDYIVTNPPWGAVSEEKKDIPEITSKESFSYFFVKAFTQLKENGIIRFLFPKSVLNVKVHKDIRRFILENCCMDSFTLYDDNFTGVVTKYVDIECSKRTPESNVSLYRNGDTEQIHIEAFYETKNFVFNFLDSEDIAIVRQVKNTGKYSLANSVWALGIVTGDNKTKLISSPSEDLEAIYTGKEIMPYTLMEAKNYILYDRSQLQQVAKEEYYRADEKLVYKFISNKLTFAYDNQRRLFLNSANILIPNIPGMSIKTVMAFLNSELYQYLYVQMFGEVKILKGNLLELPFPEISSEQDKTISNIVDEIILGNKKPKDLQQKIYAVFGISKEQLKHIKRSLYGTVA